MASSNAAYAPVRILALNDIHGYLSASDGHLTAPWQPPDSSASITVHQGGLAYMATLLKTLRAGSPNTILVSAGDNVGASPYAANIAHDEPTVAILGMLGLEVSAVGNHEFERGLTELQRIQGHGGHSSCFPGDGQFGVPGIDTCLEPGNTFSGARWTYLAANVVDTATGRTIFPATYVKRFPDSAAGRGAAVGFIGLTFRNTPLEVTQSGVVGLRFGDEATAINEAAADLRRQGVNAVVVLIHQGGYTDATAYGDPTCPHLHGDLLPILDKLSPDIPVVISGHTHTDYVCRYRDKLVTQSGHYGAGVTVLDLAFDGSGGVTASSAVNVPVINDTHGTPYPAGVQALAKDPAVDDAIHRYTALAAEAGNTVVGSITAPVTLAAAPADCAAAVPPSCDASKGNKSFESAMGDLSADAYLSAFSDGQIAFIQAGGVRNSLQSTTRNYPGPVSYAGLFATNPFHDTLVEISLTGPQILRVLEQQWEAPNNTSFFAPGGVGELLMPSAGFTYTWDSSAPAGAPSGQGRRVVADSLKLHGKPLDMSGATTYRVVIQNFLLGGGDSFSGFKAGTDPVEGGFDIAALATYMKNHPGYTPVTPNRITKLGTAP